MGRRTASGTWLPLQACLAMVRPKLLLAAVYCCPVKWRHSSEPAEATQASRSVPAAAAAARRRPRAAGTSAHGQAAITQRLCNV